MRNSLLFVVILSLFAFTALGASFWASYALAGESYSLFDGETLDGWQVLTCEAEVVDGCIFIKEGNGVLATEKQYGDFELELEWKALAEDNWDSGVYLRCPLPAEGRPWPEKYQVNIKKGEDGALPGVPSTITSGLCKDREWNHFKITAKGNVLSLEINGEHAWTYEQIEVPEGYICLQAEVPSGGQFLYKNIFIQVLE